MKNFEDCNIKKIDYKDTSEIGYEIIVPAGEGFNFPYTLFIPDKIEEETTLIIEGANTSKVSSSLEEAVIDVQKTFLDKKITKWNYETNFPILTPSFPKIYKNNETIYTNMLTSATLNYEDDGLNRIDIQLINMINDAKKRLNSNNINIDEKVILDGFSASSKFVNRFALLHPEIVKLVIGGGTSGALILPIKEIDNKKLIFPIGCGTCPEITTIKIDEFKKIKQFYYMGSEDENDPFTSDEKGKLKYSGTIELDEAKQLYKYVGEKMIPERWDNIQKIYKDLGVNATFKTYSGYGHTPTPAEEDIVNLLKSFKSKNNNKTK